MSYLAVRPLTPQSLGLTCSRCAPSAQRLRMAIRLAAGSSDGFKYMQVYLPPPLNSSIRKAEFIKSSTQIDDCPPDKLPEFALIGRSNVGKSSLINTLTRNDKLAKISKEPGMTKFINHYLINDCWYLVDLPGYGFAKAGKSSKEEWLTFTKDFFIKRENLVSVLLLIDSSVPPQEVDKDCANWLAECKVPFCIVFTKIDNRKKEMPANAQNIRAFKQLMSEEWEELPRCFETSSRTGAGRSELLGYVASLRELHVRST
ncbi:hypothetical protein Vretimale_4113 [Volvox reticuliferus]|uniref:EngB-type G domain-containing protein n=1 Tax=Volvox reticuliferus TaxID=1737510 RepID=A0A8J4FHH3_9CHLO|nr:hypothetical protein Vretifemale_1682 [Volvox reticuliferus]GIL98747.1 hypothetical protein Vretimale_4113 [Volvox reticuliferus]